MLPVLRQGSKGAAVVRWQTFLRGRGGALLADGEFGPKTRRATARYQRGLGLEADGVVGARTYGAALRDGFGGVKGPQDDWPPRPAHLRPIGGNAARARAFGEFYYTPRHATGEAIQVDSAWVRQNIVTVEIPQLSSVLGRKAGRVRFHRKAADAAIALFQAWDDAGLIDHLRTWNGSYVPRFVRGSRTTLSNHAFGTAFDINVAWNRLGSVPALRGEEGSVRELVPLANEHGFYWGGHYTKRLDGMHFELGRKV